MSSAIDKAAIETLFDNGRTYNAFLDKPVSVETLQELVRLTELGPTEANTLPGRFVFVTSPEAKAKLKAAMMPGNDEKTFAAPVNVIFAYDLAFFETLPVTFPQVDAKSWYSGRDEAGLSFVAQRSAALQIGYFTMAARALGLDVGHMGGFDANAVNEAFFAGTTLRSFVVTNLGYGDASKLYPRNPRLAFDQVARIV